MFYMYDTAIVDNLRSLVNDDRIYICPTDNVFRILARLDSDEIKLPIISLLRTNITLLSSQHSMRFNGGIAQINELTGDVDRLQSMPIRINYLLDVWTRTREENDNIIRELIFYYSTNPTLEVTIPYGLNIKHKFNLFFDDNVEDNSDIVEHKNRGEYFRQTLSIYTDDAYLWKSFTHQPIFLESVKFETKDLNGETIDVENIQFKEQEDNG